MKEQKEFHCSSFEWHEPMAQRRGSSQFLWFGMVVVVLITRSSMFPPTKRLTEVVHGIQRERKTAELKSFQTLDPAIITHKKVISYSLYGANPKSSYNTGMIANARLARNFFDLDGESVPWPNGARNNTGGTAVLRGRAGRHGQLYTSKQNVLEVYSSR